MGGALFRLILSRGYSIIMAWKAFFKELIKEGP